MVLRSLLEQLSLGGGAMKSRKGAFFKGALQRPPYPMINLAAKLGSGR